MPKRFVPLFPPLKTLRDQEANAKQRFAANREALAYKLAALKRRLKAEKQLAEQNTNAQPRGNGTRVLRRGNRDAAGPAGSIDRTNDRP